MGRSNNDIFRQLEEVIEENERLHEENKTLRADNRVLRAENKRLRKRIEVLEQTLEERIAKAVGDAVDKATAPLLTIIAQKDKEILRLKSQLDKDSSNSSKPPGSDGFKKVPNNRERSDKKQGGQPGHRGARYNIPANLDELVADGKAEHMVLSDLSDGNRMSRTGWPT